MDQQTIDTASVGTMPAELSQLTDEQLAQQVGTASAGDAAGDNGAQATPVVLLAAADVVRREEHDLTRLVDEAKKWSDKEAAMFVELVERRLQSMEQRLIQLEAR